MTVTLAAKNRLADAVYQGDVRLDKKSVGGRPVGFSLSEPQSGMATFGAGVVISRTSKAAQEVYYSEMFISLNRNNGAALCLKYRQSVRRRPSRGSANPLSCFPLPLELETLANATSQPPTDEFEAWRPCTSAPSSCSAEPGFSGDGWFGISVRLGFL